MASATLAVALALKLEAWSFGKARQLTAAETRLGKQGTVANVSEPFHKWHGHGPVRTEMESADGYGFLQNHTM